MWKECQKQTFDVEAEDYVFVSNGIFDAVTSPK